MATGPGHLARSDNREIMQVYLEEKEAEFNINCKRKTASATENPSESMRKRVRSDSNTSTATLVEIGDRRLDKCYDKIDELESFVRKLNNERDQMKQQLTKGAAQMGMLGRVINDKTQRIGALEAQVDYHRTCKSNILESLFKSQAEIKAVRNRIERCEKRPATFIAEKAAMARRYENIIESLQVANNALESKVASLHQTENQEMAALKEDRDGWVKQAAMRDEVIETYVAQLVKLDPNFERKPAEWSVKK
ncbi:MAG: hypothetical protein M1824_001535 [Vezdaea acicularis]|nr:MAG: hypothetical protein M1824_001535 [Vezdaea acicularis]